MNPQDQWNAVDRYLNDLLAPADAALDAALAACAAGKMPDIHVTPNQGKLLYLMARLQGARKILELGTLGGYSTVWLARALPADGRLVTLELEEERARVARQNLDRAGVGSLVDVRVGAALDTLPAVARENLGPFDLIFIDADKSNYPRYLDWSLKLSRPGTLVIADNVVRDGAVIDANSPDPSVQGVRRFLEMLAREKRLEATAVQTVGAKGYDGFVVARVRSDPASP